jgi:hypothetical protein
VQEELAEFDQKFEALSKEMESMDEVLSRKRGVVTFSDIVRAEGYKDILASIGNDLSGKEAEKVEIQTELKQLGAELRAFGDGEAIQKTYTARMKEYLNALNVSVLRDEDYSTQYKVVKTNVLGSDLPRSLLAQYVAFLTTMREHNDFVLCPLVIDSPFQQEQDQANKLAITEFIFLHSKSAPQMLLATVNTESVAREVAEREKANIIELDAKFGLLQADEYRSTLEWLGPLHETMLANAERQ